jgi:hypothetical protein
MDTTVAFIPEAIQKSASRRLPIDLLEARLGANFRIADDTSTALAKTRSGRLGLPVRSPAVTRASAHFWAKRERAS